MWHPQSSKYMMGKCISVYQQLDSAVHHKGNGEDSFLGKVGGNI